MFTRSKSKQGNLAVNSAERIVEKESPVDTTATAIFINGVDKTGIIDMSIEENLAASSVNFAAISSQLSSLESTVQELTRNSISSLTVNKRLERKVRELQNYNTVVDESLTALERELSRLAQYGRRESIEILGIPASVKDENLEEKVIDILGKIGVVVEKRDIVAVHRLFKKSKDDRPASTIIRFVNRKDAFAAKKNRKLLKSLVSDGEIIYKSLFIVENLCPVYKSLFEKCRRLKYQGEIKFLWSYNGTINIKYSDNKKEKPIKIEHQNDFDFYFGENGSSYDSSGSDDE